MDIARGIPQSTDNMMRDPSAEDLDAAHQLVSSARGGRENVTDFRSETQEDGTEGTSENGNGANLNKERNIQPRPHPESTDEESRPDLSKRSPKSRSKEQVFLGHSCVYVGYSTFCISVFF